MNEYTPTTDEVQDYYAHGQFADPAMSEHDHVAAFRRWLAEIERAAAARALKDFKMQIWVERGKRSSGYPDSHYGGMLHAYRLAALAPVTEEGDGDGM